MVGVRRAMVAFQQNEIIPPYTSLAEPKTQTFFETNKKVFSFPPPSYVLAYRFERCELNLHFGFMLHHINVARTHEGNLVWKGKRVQNQRRKTPKLIVKLRCWSCHFFSLGFISSYSLRYHVDRFFRQLLGNGAKCRFRWMLFCIRFWTNSYHDEKRNFSIFHYHFSGDFILDYHRYNGSAWLFCDVMQHFK